MQVTACPRSLVDSDGCARSRCTEWEVPWTGGTPGSQRHATACADICRSAATAKASSCNFVWRGTAPIAAFDHSAERHGRRTRCRGPMAECRSQYHPNASQTSRRPGLGSGRTRRSVAVQPQWEEAGEALGDGGRESSAGQERLTSYATQQRTVPADEQIPPTRRHWHRQARAQLQRGPPAIPTARTNSTPTKRTNTAATGRTSATPPRRANRTPTGRTNSGGPHATAHNRVQSSTNLAAGRQASSMRSQQEIR
jgi:hypothetical protein